jgi:hypothetical protein
LVNDERIVAKDEFVRQNVAAHQALHRMGMARFWQELSGRLG